MLRYEDALHKLSQLTGLKDPDLLVDKYLESEPGRGLCGGGTPPARPDGMPPPSLLGGSIFGRLSMFQGVPLLPGSFPGRSCSLALRPCCLHLCQLAYSSLFGSPFSVSGSLRVLIVLLFLPVSAPCWLFFLDHPSQPQWRSETSPSSTSSMSRTPMWSTCRRKSRR